VSLIFAKGLFADSFTGSELSVDSVAGSSSSSFSVGAFIFVTA